jgi:hypothetical protein
MKLLILLGLFGVFLSATVFAQDAAPSSVEGVWKVTEETFMGANPSSTSNAQPALLILTKTHYSFIRVVGQKPRPLFKAINPTAEEKIAAFDSFTASSGTYELVGSTLTMRPAVSKHPNFMAGGSEKYEIRLEAFRRGHV